jgi:MFS family permease
MTAITETHTAAARAAPRISRYAWYVLAGLFTIYCVNFVDRQILAIVAEDVKRDLGLRDAQLGFLYGTAFAIFYALFSLPLARLADNWSRRGLMGAGLVLWSVTTMLSGLAGGFTQLALVRTLVGVGEASAAPAAFSMLADVFPPRRRALVASIYTSGAYLGGGLSLPVGAWFLLHWNGAWGLRGWQAAFICIGLVGVLLTVWVLTIREPRRGGFDAQPAPPPPPGVWRQFGADVMAILPPFTLLTAARHGDLARVGGVAAAIALLGALLAWATGDVAQWVVLGIGFHAVHAWTCSLRRADPVTWALTCGSPITMLTLAGIGALMFVLCAFAFWMTPLALRQYRFASDAVGLAIGLPNAILSVVGIVLGGWLSDYWRARDPRGRVFVMMLSIGVPAPFMAAMCLGPSFTVFCLLTPFVSLFSAFWAGSAVTLMQDQVLPRMRGTASAAYLLASNMLGLALGPYATGKLAEVTGSLPLALLLTLGGVPVALLLLAGVARGIARCEASRMERALAAGEGSEHLS